MNSAEKPYQHLSSAEKEIFNICGEIIKYRWGKFQGIELSELRERAIELFIKMKTIDFSEHDSYFKLIAEANEIKKEFQELKSLPTESKLIDIDLEENNPESATNKLMSELTGANNLRVFFDWIPTDHGLDEEEQAEHYYSDMTMIDITREKNDKFRLMFNEMYDHQKFTSSPHIKTFYETYRQENSRFTEHEHEGPETKEYWLSMDDLSRDEVRERIQTFLKILKENPRLKKE